MIRALNENNHYILYIKTLITKYNYIKNISTIYYPIEVLLSHVSLRCKTIYASKLIIVPKINGISNKRGTTLAEFYENFRE